MRALAILLTVLLCQFIAIGSAFSVQYPSGEHPMGESVSHHHSHSDLMGDPKQGALTFNASEVVTHFDETSDSNLSVYESSFTDAGEPEHEHAQHSHTPSHPPADLLFITRFFPAVGLMDDDISYLNCCYAPPVRPPHA